ncbi:MAG TPA: 3-oxoacyl-ACP reductase FabG [Polyangia bacterium]|jgi:3-oxoacyl-[acyl-carrier protein] reductase|nr:3-oxoacyl-ACP reductase FabG [Polyangia bacterium]
MTKVALVTGASRGIGAAIARELAAAGCRILLNYRSDERGATEVRDAIAAAGGEATLLRFDVADAAETAAALAPFSGDGDGGSVIDVVVNNAGVVKDSPFPTQALADWERVTRTSLDGFFNVTRPLVMPLVRRRWGRIINIASLAGLVGNRGQVSYSAAKAGLIGATRSLAKEVAKRNVTVNAVAPGLIDTDMLKQIPVDDLTKLIPMRRLGLPSEVAKLVRFLASDDAAYITGQVITIDGGLA